MSALAAVAGRLRCPNCGASLQPGDRALACTSGHRFDIARQGYVALLPPRGRGARGDSADMVAARVAFLSAGHFAPIADALVGAARAAVGAGAGLVVDVGAGPGSYLAALLDALPDRWAVALDPSRPALRRAARAHPRIAAVACDAWQELPVASGTAGLVVNVFAPRNGSEIARVLAPEGALVVVTPTARHLAQVVEPLGLLGVDAEKASRLQATLSPDLQEVSRRTVEFDMTLGHADMRALVAMGPSAHHVGADELGRRLARLPGEVRVTASVNVDTFAPAG